MHDGENSLQLTPQAMLVDPAGCVVVLSTCPRSFGGALIVGRVYGGWLHGPLSHMTQVQSWLYLRKRKGGVRGPLAAQTKLNWGHRRASVNQGGVTLGFLSVVC